MTTALGIGLLTAQGAWAQSARTWISGIGDDANPCSRTAPCKTFVGAEIKTSAGGEVDTLDPGGFGAVTLTKSITLADEGTGVAGSQVSGTNAIVVNCTTDPNCVVVIRGLVVDGTGTGLNGVNFLAGKTLILENMTIRGFSSSSAGFGVMFQPNASQSYNLMIENCTISTSGTGSVGSGIGAGVEVAPRGGVANVNVVLDHVRLVDGNAGLRVDNSSGAGAINVTVSNSAVSQNVNGGVAAISPSKTTPAVISIDHSIVAQNNVGLNARAAGAVIRFGSSAVSGNAEAIKFSNGGTVSTYGDNQMNDNTSIGTPPTSSPTS
jgi:hypothetical protein